MFSFKDLKDYLVSFLIIYKRKRIINNFLQNKEPLFTPYDEELFEKLGTNTWVKKLRESIEI